MSQTRGLFPPGYTQLFLPEIDSTNSEALRRAGQGAPGNLWIRAARQGAGRGRSGRTWTSPEGNLFASLLLRPGCGLETCLQLAFVAGLSLYDAVLGLAGDGLAARLALKWPNDLLLDGAKLAGVLLESTGSGGAGAAAVVIGTGLNLVSHPDDTTLPATDLAARGIHVAPEEAFVSLAVQTARWLERWAEGRGWEDIRAVWSARDLPEGAPIRVRAGDEEHRGAYGGIDASGALQIIDAGGARRSILAGDVFPL